jgi:hypothetical protein
MQSSAEKLASEAPRGMKLLHLILLGTGVLTALVFVVLIRVRGPFLVPDSATPVIAFAFAGIGLTLVAFTVFLLRPRIPVRGSGQALTDFWSSGPARGRSVLVWILCENASILAGVGYLLTGHVVGLVTIAIALIALAWFNPARLADEA